MNGGSNGNGYQPRYTLDDTPQTAEAGDLQELEGLRAENDQLRTLCAELEQALQEASQQGDSSAVEEQMRTYEMLLEEKNDTIRQLHEQLADVTAALEDDQRGREQTAPRRPQGPLPREEELLALSEELERERRQLQEDEQALMEQMRQMEVTMARERAEMARQRNDLQRLYGEIRHELERLERNGALQSKIDGLKSRLQDVTNRRGAAPQTTPGSSPALPQPAPGAAAAQPTPTKGASFMGRLFGGNGNNGNR
jgi:chromosome segregation ATPase